MQRKADTAQHKIQYGVHLSIVYSLDMDMAMDMNAQYRTMQYTAHSKELSTKHIIACAGMDTDVHVDTNLSQPHSTNSAHSCRNGTKAEVQSSAESLIRETEFSAYLYNVSVMIHS